MTAEYILKENITGLKKSHKSSSSVSTRHRVNSLFFSPAKSQLKGKKELIKKNNLPLNGTKETKFILASQQFECAAFGFICVCGGCMCVCAHVFAFSQPRPTHCLRWMAPTPTHISAFSHSFSHTKWCRGGEWKGEGMKENGLSQCVPLFHSPF